MANTPPIFRTVTLGCKVNQYETQWCRDALSQLGYVEAQHGQSADLCIVNTCTVTGESDVKGRKMIRQLARKNPNAEIVVMGCYATRMPDLLAKMPGVSEVITDKALIPDFFRRRGLDPMPDGIRAFGTRHRAYVKVQDGCVGQCAYCIIPSVRPKLQSRTIDDVSREVQQLVRAGYSEIVLTGIHLGHYGIGFNATPCKNTPGDHPKLHDLVRKLAQFDGEFRIRLSSLEAIEVSDELIELIGEHPDRICPHLHLSMQSGSDRVLQRMRRRWMSHQFTDCCRAISNKLDLPAITTDVIVGFPGETEDDFQQTCDAARACGFSKIHIFRFSPREGTLAATMPDQIPGQLKAQRADRLAKLEQELRTDYFQKLVGRPLQMMVERHSQDQQLTDCLTGTSERYAQVEIALPLGSNLATPPADLVGRLIESQSHELKDDRLICRSLIF